MSYNVAFPLYNGGITSPYHRITLLQFIPIPPECAIISLPQLTADSDYPHRYTLTEVEVPVYRIYCKHKNNVADSGNGSVDSPYSNFQLALDHASCVTSMAQCYWVQIVIMSGSEVLRSTEELLDYRGDYNQRIILGSTDGTTYFQIASETRLQFSGVISQCEMHCAGSDFLLLTNCTLKEGASIRCTYAINCTATKNYFSPQHMYDCVCDTSFVGATSMNKCKITLNSSETEHNISRAAQYVYDSEISVISEFVYYSEFESDIISGSTFQGIKVRCTKLLENSSITLNFPDRVQSGANIWGVSGRGDTIVTMEANSAVKNVTVSGKNKFQFTGSGRGYYGIIAVISPGTCAISNLTANLSTSAVELSDFTDTNQHWCVLSYTCAHAVSSGSSASCVLGCDYRQVELHPEEGFDWAKPCTEIII